MLGTDLVGVAPVLHEVAPDFESGGTRVSHMCGLARSTVVFNDSEVSALFQGFEVGEAHIEATEVEFLDIFGNPVEGVGHRLRDMRLAVHEHRPAHMITHRDDAPLLALRHHLFEPTLIAAQVNSGPPACVWVCENEFPERRVPIPHNDREVFKRERGDATPCFRGFPHIEYACLARLAYITLQKYLRCRREGGEVSRELIGAVYNLDAAAIQADVRLRNERIDKTA